MGILGNAADAFKAVAGKLKRGTIGKAEDRTDRRASELAEITGTILAAKLVEAGADVAEQLDADDRLTGLTDDAANGLAGKYRFVVEPIQIPRIIMRLERIEQEDKPK